VDAATLLVKGQKTKLKKPPETKSTRKGAGENQTLIQPGHDAGKAERGVYAPKKTRNPETGGSTTRRTKARRKFRNLNTFGEEGKTTGGAGRGGWHLAWVATAFLTEEKNWVHGGNTRGKKDAGAGRKKKGVTMGPLKRGLGL